MLVIADETFWFIRYAAPHLVDGLTASLRIQRGWVAMAIRRRSGKILACNCMKLLFDLCH
jgi:hypothetical protein